MQCLIVGYGSIGKRHARILSSLGYKIVLVTLQVIQEFPCYRGIRDALRENKIDFVIIANPTYLHHQALMEVIKCNYQGVVLVEKPIFAENKAISDHKLHKILVAYNLRFSKLLQQLQKILNSETIISFSVNVGQYLPSWRKDGDYRNCYSANKSQGGGVLRDLSHELDYTLWLCGKYKRVTALGGHFSKLEIETEDVFSILMECERCPVVNLQLNYLDRVARREILIHTQNHTLFVDLKKGTLSKDGIEIERFEDDISNTYIEQHRAIQNGDYHQFCSYEEGLMVIKLIEKVADINKLYFGVEA